MDLSMRTPYMPAAGETILGGPFTTGPGGKGANQTVAAARLGAQTSMLVKLGLDVFGDQAARNLENEGVSGEYILRSDDSHTGVAFIIVDDSGENMIVVASGTNFTITPADVEKARPAIESADILLMQLEVPLDVVLSAARIAHQAGVKVVLNPAPGQVLSDELLRMVDVLTPNETEAQIIAQMPVTTVEQAQAAAAKLIQNGVGALVITLGAKGALVATPDGFHHVPGYSVHVVDTTGAGDAFSGALAVALAEGQSLVQAAAFANAAAALQVTKPGTAPAMPHRNDVEALMSAQR
jgi:ribokinase